MRGMLGQYIIALPDKDAIVVRLGRKRHEAFMSQQRETPVDVHRYLDMAVKMLR